MILLLNLRAIALCFLLLTQLPIDKNGWRGIVPLHATRTDLERLVRSKVVRCAPDALSCLFFLDNERVFVMFADELTCRSDDATNSWRVPRGTVIEITVRFSKAMQLSDLGFDLSRFEKTLDKEFPSIAYYNNSNDGILIESAGPETRSVTYYAASKDDNLNCKYAKDPKTVKP